VRARKLALVILLTAAATARPARADDDWLGRDKALHFAVAMGLASGAYGVSALKLEPMWQRAAVGAGFALTLGAAKELYDLGGRGDPSWKDFTWDAIGALVGVGLALAVDAITRAHDDGAAAAASPLRLRF
jgi:putative lipoprotein